MGAECTWKRWVDHSLPGPVDLALVFNSSNAFGLVPVSGQLAHWELTALNLAVVPILLRAVLHETERLKFAGFAMHRWSHWESHRPYSIRRGGRSIQCVEARVRLGFNVADVSIDIRTATLLFTTFLARPGPTG